jgi:hypothetical protein
MNVWTSTSPHLASLYRRLLSRGTDLGHHEKGGKKKRLFEVKK